MNKFKLFKAVRKNNVRMVKSTVEAHQSLVNEENYNRRSPLQECLSYGLHARHYDGCQILEILVSHGADVNTPAYGSGLTPVMLAVKKKCLKCLRLLFRNGADLSVASTVGTTALIFSIKQSASKCAGFLIQYATPALLNHRDDGGWTALMWATKCPGRYMIPLCKQLLEAGADVNLRDNQGLTALEIALPIEATRVELVSLLLEKGALVNTIARGGETPLYRAIVCGGVSLVDEFLNQGADPTLSMEHEFFIHDKIANNDTAIVRALVMHGFPPQDLSWPNYDDFEWPPSPLACAFLEDKPDIARYLITNKFYTCSDTSQNAYRNTELRQLVERFSSKECLQILDFHLQSVQTLSTLCLVTISSALVQDFRREDLDQEKPFTRCMFKPTFKERVKSLELPSVFKRALLHQTQSSKICCAEWKNIALEKEIHFPECKDCEFCS